MLNELKTEQDSHKNLLATPFSFRKMLSGVLLPAIFVGLFLNAGSIATAQEVGAASLMPGVTVKESNPTGVKQLVTFGDSFTANGAADRNLQPVPGTSIAGKVCLTDLQNWPHQMAERTGKTLGDWSCNGMGANIPLTQLRRSVEGAIEYGDIGPGTEKVIIMYGGLDLLTWKDTAVDMFIIDNPQGFESAYTATISQIAARVKYVAPGADVVIAGYPSIIENNQLCLVNPLKNGVMGLYVPRSSEALNRLNDVQWQAAQRHNLQFVNLLDKSRGHGLCAPRAEDRWMAGFIDRAEHAMPIHPTDTGQHEMGRIMASEVYPEIVSPVDESAVIPESAE